MVQKSSSPVEEKVVFPTIYKVLAPSKRWLGMGFLNHQQYVWRTTNDHCEFPPHQEQERQDQPGDDRGAKIVNEWQPELYPPKTNMSPKKGLFQ